MTRSSTSWPVRKAPDCQSIASTSVVLPWSTWATIAMFRRSSRRAGRAVGSVAHGARDGRDSPWTFGGRRERGRVSDRAYMREPLLHFHIQPLNHQGVPALAELADFCIRHRRLTVLAWMPRCSSPAPAGAAGESFSTNFNLPDSDSTKALNLLEDRFPAQSGDQIQVVYADQAGLDRLEATEQQIETLVTDLGKLDHVVSVTSPFEGQGCDLAERHDRLFDGDAGRCRIRAADLLAREYRRHRQRRGRRRASGRGRRRPGPPGRAAEGGRQRDVSGCSPRSSSC